MFCPLSQQLLGANPGAGHWGDGTGRDGGEDQWGVGPVDGNLRAP